MSASSPSPASVACVTRAIAGPPGGLIASLPEPTGTLCFAGADTAFVGWGVHAAFVGHGPDVAGQISRWFSAVIAELVITGDVQGTGSGPIAFVSLGFDDDDESVAFVPTTVLGRRGSEHFCTVIGSPGLLTRQPIGKPGRISYCDATMSVAGFTSAVASATARIRAGELDKVVLAHDLEATAERDIDERHLLAKLAESYPSCWTYAVAGLVGASPEMLIRRTGPDIASRVLAGTAWPEHAGEAVSAGLLSSEKELAEHHFAVTSVAKALGEVVVGLDVPDAPHPLVLANLTHLATDISGTLPAGGPSALELAALLHPTAAVGGTPAAAARALIRELEPVRRGRYAAPVGWLDSRGDGEFAIALRCATVSGRTVRMVAGCGIVADSDPQTEAREAQIKMVAIRDALEATT